MKLEGSKISAGCLVFLLIAASEANASCTHGNCQACAADTANGCQWCGMTVNNKLQQNGAIGQCIGSTETCANDATFDGFAALFDDTKIVDGGGAELAKFTLSSKKIEAGDSANCPSAPFDASMEDDSISCNSCLSSTKSMCVFAYHAWGGVDPTTVVERFCVDDVAHCKHDVFDYGSVPVVIPAVKLFKYDAGYNCGTVDSSVPKPCTGKYDCDACENATDSDCEWCYPTAEVDTKELSLYNGFCRAPGLCNKDSTDLSGIKKFADATVGGKTSAMKVTASPATCSATPSDEYVFHYDQQTCQLCTKAGKTWCATTFMGSDTNSGGACVKDAAACTAFETASDPLGFKSLAVAVEGKCATDIPTTSTTTTTTAPSDPTSTSDAVAAKGVSLTIGFAVVAGLVSIVRV